MFVLRLCPFRIPAVFTIIPLGTRHGETLPGRYRFAQISIKQIGSVKLGQRGSVRETVSCARETRHRGGRISFDFFRIPLRFKDY